MEADSRVGIEAAHSEASSELSDLQARSLVITAAFVGVIGYVWLLSIVWFYKWGPPLGMWAPAGILATAALASLALPKRPRGKGPAAAPVVLTLGIFASVAYAMLGYHLRDFAYLLVLVVLFASVLLGQTAALFAAALASLIIAWIGRSALQQPLLSRELLFPIGAVLLSAVGSSLLARNLYSALTWALASYYRSRENEEKARSQRSELLRTLKALDEATYRLERTHQMLAMARDQAEEARRLKQQFAQTISHELRTPLNLIVGFTELMAQSSQHYGVHLPPDFLRDLSTVHRYSRHLQTLINDVLDLARIEAAQMAILPETVDPAELANDAINTVRSLVEARGLALHTAIEPDLPSLYVDPIRIRQVLFNLLNNAACFTQQGAVTVGVRYQDDSVVFSVADTGPGIAPEDIPRVFREFEQLDSSTRRRHGGAGLGLAISKQFVEMHQGRIWVESILGRGSTFHFSLPVSQREFGISHDALPASPAQPNAIHWHKEWVLLAVTRSPSAATLLTRYLRGTAPWSPVTWPRRGIWCRRLSPRQS